MTDTEAIGEWASMTIHDPYSGGFVTAFAETWLKADPTNRAILLSAAKVIANKYPRHIRETDGYSPPIPGIIRDRPTLS